MLIFWTTRGAKWDSDLLDSVRRTVRRTVVERAYRARYPYLSFRIDYDGRIYDGHSSSRYENGQFRGSASQGPEVLGSPWYDEYYAGHFLSSEDFYGSAPSLDSCFPAPEEEASNPICFKFISGSSELSLIVDHFLSDRVQVIDFQDMQAGGVSPERN